MGLGKFGWDFISLAFDLPTPKKYAISSMSHNLSVLALSSRAISILSSVCLIVMVWPLGQIEHCSHEF